MTSPTDDAFRTGEPDGQRGFAAALLDPDLPCPPGLCAWNGSDPARRFAVYRNNVVSALVGALADTFPVLQQSVGEDFFRAMAAVFVRERPPRSRVLAHYGEGFADFVAGFPPAAGLPWLPDLARLEHARLQACHAADAVPMDAAAFAASLSAPDALAVTQVAWHPSLRVFASPHAVVSWWAAHQLDGEVPAIDIDRPESAIVLRDGLDVVVLPVDAGTASVVRRTLDGATLLDAVADAVAADPSFDPGGALAHLVSHGALVALHPLSSPRS